MNKKNKKKKILTWVCLGYDTDEIWKKSEKLKKFLDPRKTVYFLPSRVIK